MSELSRKVGLTSKDLKYIFENICTDFHDSLIIDKSRPYAKLRIFLRLYLIITDK